MTNDEYPSLYRCADAASLKAQCCYLFMHRLYLGSLVLGSVFGALGYFDFVVIILVLGLILLFMIRSRKDDKTWFDGRAVAESVKTSTWRFMMRAQPFHNEKDVQDIFISDLKEIRGARPDLARAYAATTTVDKPAISKFMQERRDLSLDKRREWYINERIKTQLTWYASKAQMHAKYGNFWYWMIFILQGVSVIMALYQLKSGMTAVNLVPITTTFAAAIAAWNQTKRHDELSQSYALAAQELGDIEAIANSQTDEILFSQLVEQAENAISREHTMWCARRDVRLPRPKSLTQEDEGK